jgi:ribosome assembly protein RRB1
MPKRAAPQDASEGPYLKAQAGAAKRDAEALDEMGEFEDAWEDEIESDEDAVDGDEDGVQLALIHVQSRG